MKVSPGFESLLLRQKAGHPMGVPRFFRCAAGIRKDGPTGGRAKKCPADTFFVRGRIHSLMNAPGTGVGRRLSNAAKKQNKSALRWRSHRRGAKRPVDTFFVRGRIRSLMNAPGTGVGRRLSHITEKQVRNVIRRTPPPRGRSARRTLFSSVGGSIAFCHQEEFTPLTDIPRRGIFFLPQIVAIATKL